jgi:signal transduction histidine kinase
MRTSSLRGLGIILIHAGVILRCLYRLPRLQYPEAILVLLALNACLIILEAALTGRQASEADSRQGHGEHSSLGAIVRPLYLLIQTGIVLALLLLNRPPLDFCALLFTPISMSAVLYYGRRKGFIWIAAFTVAMAVPLIVLQTNKPAGALMTLTYGGLAFLMGGYAYQVREAEAARWETGRMLGELQLAHARLQQAAGQREELAAEHERNRLARELHDSVTQTVFSMNLTVQAARLLLGRDNARATSQLLRLEELGASALREIQTLVSSLRPTPAPQDGLPAALRRLASAGSLRLPGQSGTGGPGGLRVVLEVTGNRVLPEPVAAGLYLIAQEALTNAAKHAGVREAVVRLRLDERAAFLEVEDRGCGFVLHSFAAEPGHLGLSGMGERARDLGWHLTIDSQPGRGTRVRVEECPREATP